MARAVSRATGHFLESFPEILLVLFFLALAMALYRISPLLAGIVLGYVTYWFWIVLGEP